MANKEVDLSLEFSLAKIQDSIIGGELQEKDYLNAVKNARVPEIDEILEHPQKYKNIIDGNGEINVRYLTAAFYVLSGKTGDNYLKLGGHFNYFTEKKKWKEMGYENRHDFFTNNPNFPFSETYCFQAECIYKLVRIGRLDPERLLKIGSKATLLSDNITSELSANEIMKIVKQIEKLSYREAQQFIRSGDYRYILAGEDIPERKQIPVTREDPEYVQITFTMPKFKSRGRTCQQYFATETEQQVYALALRELIQEGIIQGRMEDIVNRPEGEAWKKKLIKREK